MLLGKILHAGAWVVQGVTFDGHNSHAYIKECLYGDFQKLDKAALAEVPFWGTVAYDDLPHHALPHLPLKLCVADGQAIWGLAGPCTLASCWGCVCGLIFVDICRLYSEYIVKYCEYIVNISEYIVNTVKLCEYH